MLTTLSLETSLSINVVIAKAEGLNFPNVLRIVAVILLRIEIFPFLYNI